MRWLILILAILIASILIQGCSGHFDEISNDVELQKKCNIDSDCIILQSEPCAPCNGGYDAYNKEAKDLVLDEKKRLESGEECPSYNCGTSFEIRRAVCDDNFCVMTTKRNCDALCNYESKEYIISQDPTNECECV
jgi:hypothetical protein